MPPPLLDGTALSAALAELPGVRQLGDQLVARWRFVDFAAAVAFGARLAAIAAAQDHHPEWTVRHREVDFATTTHDASGITARDVVLATAAVAAAYELGARAVAPAAAPARGTLWAPPGHFYSPLPDPAELEADAKRRWPPQPRELPGIDLRLPEQVALAQQLARCYPDADLPDVVQPERRYCTANEYFGFGDAFVYQALLRQFRPQRVVEVGSGWSTALLLDTDDRWLGGRTEVTCIEPFPDRLHSLLFARDWGRVRLLQQRVQDVALAEFAALQAGDVLFVDSSHVAKTGSDVVHLVCEVLPRLCSGVLVHCHDVHANFEYDEAWVREGRAWNEAYFLRAFLQHSTAFEIVLHAPTLALHAAELLLPLMPRVGENTGGSLWLRRR
jgi:pterin-4a-carbinolamine dehydratase